MEKAKGHYGQFDDAVKYIDPRTANKRRTATMALFEGYERRIDKINGVLAAVRYFRLWKSARPFARTRASTLMTIAKGIQPICFENACWAYTVGAAIAMKKGVQDCCRGSRGHRHWPAGLLHPGLRGRRPEGRPGPWQPGRHAPARRDQVLCFPGRPRVLCRRRGRHRHRQELPTRPARSPCASSSTAWARTPRRSSPASTASPMCRPSSTTTPAS